MNDIDKPGADLATIPIELLADAVDALEEGIAIVDGANRLVTFNRRFRDLLDAGEALVPGADWATLDQGELADPNAKSWSDLAERAHASGAKHVELRVLGERYFELTYRPTRHGGFVVTRTDVTDRHLAELLAREREMLLTAILETNPIPVVMARVSDGKIVYSSPAAQEMLAGSTNARAAYFDPDARAEYIRLLQTHGKVEDFRVKRRFLDGSVKTMSLSGALTEFGGEMCVVSSVSNLTEILRREALIRRVVEACPAPVLMNRAATGEILYRSPMVDQLFGVGDTTSVYWADPADRAAFLAALRRKTELLDWRGQFVNAAGDTFQASVSARVIEFGGEEVIVSHTRDLTADLALEAQLDHQREQMFQNEKMMALGGLMAGVAHELNNPLSVVVGHAMMLEEEVRDPSTLRQIAKISAAAERCAKIVKAFLSMARQEPARMEHTAINDVIETAVEVARYGETHAPVSVATELDPDLPPVSSDPDQIAQVVINLVINAAQAMGQTGGQVTVRSDRSGRDVRISVEDDGPGVPEAIRARIFEPFFTTKGVGQGTGIGLAMCHRIISAHKGTIRLESPSGGGARFVVALPMAEIESEQADKAQAPHQTRDAARVLVIDDEPAVADLNAEILNRGGFDARVAYTAQDASAHLSSGPFDAVLSDLNMPDMDGRGVYDAVCASQPDLARRTGFLTGDTMGATSQAFLGEVGRPFIEKPVSPSELRAFVAQLVSGGPE
ncbi:MAG: ATP-binding protein [Pseudomonadota bacterium]